MRLKNKTVVQPCNPERGNPNFTTIIAQGDWRVGRMPQGYRHPETRRNEMFLMNVTLGEFQFLECKHMPDFRRCRLGDRAYIFNTETPVNNPWLRPMFGTLTRSQRLAKRERKYAKSNTAVSDALVTSDR